MLFFILLIIGCCIVSILSYYGNDRDIIYAKIGFIISFIIGITLTCIIYSASYGTYIEMRKKLATIEQYKEAIDLYAEKGIEEFKISQATSMPITDMKYQNYQSKMGQMIIDLRTVIVEYNTILSGKRTMKNNILWNWIIICPNDLVPVQISNYIK